MPLRLVQVLIFGDASVFVTTASGSWGREGAMESYAGNIKMISVVMRIMNK